MKPTLYGSYANEGRLVAWCGYHRKWLTVNQLKERGCLGKQCDALKKLEHTYWVQREVIKNRKREREIGRK